MNQFDTTTVSVLIISIVNEMCYELFSSFSSLINYIGVVYNVLSQVRVIGDVLQHDFIVMHSLCF